MLRKIDKPFLISFVILVVAGFLIFSSASLGLLARSESRFTAIALNQLFFGLCLGSVACVIASLIPARFWKKYSLAIFIFTIILAALVLVPGIGLTRNGATRWLPLLGYTFQPSELLKLGYIFYLAAVLAKHRGKLDKLRYGLLPFLVITAIVGALILPEPDNDTFFMIAFSGFIMYFVAGGRKREILGIIAIGIVCIGSAIAFWPYARERVATFINPSENSLTSGYQIQQSLIAIGSGGLLGKGFGQSTQKFNFLPEPIGDSIFAVAGEEFGLWGSITIIVLYLFFALRGLKIALGAPDDFSRLLVIGIVILITASAFLNIAAMLGIIPLTGTPLTFASQGGTALFIAMAEVGIILNVSKHIKK